MIKESNHDKNCFPITVKIKNQNKLIDGVLLLDLQRKEEECLRIIDHNKNLWIIPLEDIELQVFLGMEQWFPYSKYKRKTKHLHDASSITVNNNIKNEKRELLQNLKKILSNKLEKEKPKQMPLFTSKSKILSHIMHLFLLFDEVVYLQQGKEGSDSIHITLILQNDTEEEIDG